MLQRLSLRFLLHLERLLFTLRFLIQLAQMDFDLDYVQERIQKLGDSSEDGCVDMSDLRDDLMTFHAADTVTKRHTARLSADAMKCLLLANNMGHQIDLAFEAVLGKKPPVMHGEETEESRGDRGVSPDRTTFGVMLGRASPAATGKESPRGESRDAPFSVSLDRQSYLGLGSSI